MLLPLVDSNVRYPEVVSRPIMDPVSPDTKVVQTGGITSSQVAVTAPPIKMKAEMVGDGPVACGKSRCAQADC